MKLLVIDGNSIINRAFYGIKILTTKDGVFTNGVYGFMNILFKLLDSENPDCVAVAFDLKAPTFRHKLYRGYKAGRHATPPELLSQIPILKELLLYLGMTVVEKEGFEADDILGTLSSAAEKSGHTAVISTGDKDSLQLIDEHTKVLLASTKMGRAEVTVMTKEALKEKYGLTPPEMIELKALMGDSSDKIPGVRGIGEKTATELISRYHSIEYIYDNLDALDIKDSVKQKLNSDKENAFLSKKLGTIVRDVPIDLNIEHYILKPHDTEKLYNLLRKLEFYKMLEKLGAKDVTEKAAFDKSINKTDKINGTCFIVKFDDGAAFCTEEGYGKISEEDLLELLSKNSKNIVVHGSKEWYRYMQKKGIAPKIFLFDTELACYLLEPAASSYSLDKMYSHYLSGDIKEQDTAEKSAIMGYNLYKKTAEEIKSTGEEKLLFEIEMPLALVLASMEDIGFLLDRKGLTSMNEELKERLAEIEKAIYENAGETFNINSPKQLGVILFEKLGLPAKKKTKSGYSTNAEVLESLKGLHPIIDSILEYRVLTKLKATYCEGLLLKMDSDDVVHSTFIQTETRTGRISSAEPNLQNIPVRKEEGKRLREFFIARKGRVLLDADYSQIELRVLAALSGDENMIKAFKNGADIHTITASEVFGLPENMVTPLLRSRAKAVNFGIVYGIGAFSLSKDIGVSRKEAENYIKGYYGLYKGIAKYMDDIVQKAKDTGYSVTLFNRRRYLPELNSSNGMLRAFGERVARNMPIQGTAADIIKIAMIRVFNRLKEEKLDANLILQVHDELIVEAKESDADRAAKIIEEEMEGAAKLKVKLLAEVGRGKNWLEAKG